MQKSPWFLRKTVVGTRRNVSGWWNGGHWRIRTCDPLRVKDCATAAPSAQPRGKTDNNYGTKRFPGKRKEARRRVIGLRFGGIKISWPRLKSTSASTSQQLVAAARELSARVARLKFAPPVTHVYNPLTYARQSHEEFLRRFGGGRKRVVFLGMNPGPFGMVQTGIPFGEIAAVRDWLKISAPIEKPAAEHPKRPMLGFGCPRSEVSGRRLVETFCGAVWLAGEIFCGTFRGAIIVRWHFCRRPAAM